MQSSNTETVKKRPEIKDEHACYSKCVHNFDELLAAIPCIFINKSARMHHLSFHPLGRDNLSLDFFFSQISPFDFDILILKAYGRPLDYTIDEHHGIYLTFSLKYDEENQN